MSNGQINRFEWRKAVGQADDLKDSAKTVAMALALQFANDQTGQINPSIKTLSSWVKQSTDTAKRAVKALVDAGWLVRSEGRGRGNNTAYVLCSPGKVVPIAVKNKGGAHAPKRGHTCTTHIKDKQSLEQRGTLPQSYRAHRFTGNAFDGLVVIPSTNRDALYAWGHWLKEHGLPALDHYPIEAAGRKTGSSFFLCRGRRPQHQQTLKQKPLNSLGR